MYNAWRQADGHTEVLGKGSLDYYTGKFLRIHLQAYRAKMGGTWSVCSCQGEQATDRLHGQSAYPIDECSWHPIVKAMGYAPNPFLLF